MPKRIRILPYRLTSDGSRELARAVGGLRVRLDGAYRPQANDLVVNWGSGDKPRWWKTGLNDPDRVSHSGNKLLALAAMSAANVSVPPFTVDINDAQAWLREGKVVVGRKVLRGSRGIGCVVYTKETDEPERCPLYTQHIRHKREFRVHVFGGRIIDMVEKRARREVEDRDKWIRNHDNGYVFCRDNLVVPEVVQREALAAALALRLDFGGVDVVFREKENRAFVLEVNTAPGLEGTTIKSYAKAIQAAAA